MIDVKLGIAVSIYASAKSEFTLSWISVSICAQVKGAVIAQARSAVCYEVAASCVVVVDFAAGGRDFGSRRVAHHGTGGASGFPARVRRLASRARRRPVSITERISV